MAAATPVHNCYSLENSPPKQTRLTKPPPHPKPVPTRLPNKPKPLTRPSNRLSLPVALRGLRDSRLVVNALDLFDKMPHSDTYLWNVIIRGLTTNGLFEEAMGFYYRMGSEGIRPDKFTFPFVIKACAGLVSLFEGQKVHGRLVKVGLDLDLYVSNFLIDFYAKVGFVGLAVKVFDEMPERDLVSWNTMVCGYQSVGESLSSLMLFREMLGFGYKADRFSVMSALGACSAEGCLDIGKEIHCQVIRNELDSDIMVQASLVDMYGKCGRVTCAEEVFNRILLRNIVAWNAMIDAYARNSCLNESFDCLKRMQEDDKLMPDAIAIINLLPACTHFGAILEAKSLHGYAIRRLFLPHLVLETALVGFYGESSELVLAERVFFGMKEKNLVSRNAMIAAFVQNRREGEALRVFREIWRDHLEPDAITLSSILPAYAELALLSECRQIHAYITKLELRSNTLISNAVVYMYAKCGDLRTAKNVFDRIEAKDVVSWNTIIMAYAIHGFGRTCIQLFTEMEENGIKPNQSSFVSLLTSCSVSGMIDEGSHYFNSMKREYNIDPGIEHFGCMLDLLGRNGNLEAARRFIEEMPLAPTARIWGSLLAASWKYNDIEMAEYAAEHVLSLEHNNTGCYVMLLNMYSRAGRWEDVDRIKLRMKDEGLKKTTMYSMVETSSKCHVFINQDKSHKQTHMIHEILDIVSKNIGEDIYVHSLAKFRPQDLNEKRAKSGYNHSVRLAICFGLISTALGEPVIVKKNVRMCENCHCATKKISMSSKREIVVGDSRVFHHFRNGNCSCGDYW